MTLLFSDCKETNPQCLITFEKVRQSDPLHILINQADKEIEDRNFASTNTGGYYSFYKNGLLKSYDFFTSKDTIYDKRNDGNKIIEGDTTTHLYSLSSYAEHYDSTGKVQDVFGNPLVYKEIELQKMVELL